MQKALADDFPSDLPRLIDGVAPNEKKMKNVFGFFFFFPTRPLGRGRQTHLQTTTLSSLCMSYKCSLIPHTHTHKSVFSGSHTHTHTPTYVAAVLTDGVRGGPHLPKCRCWTDCGGVMNGWSRLGRGAEETISAMLISPLLLRSPSIPHPPFLPLILSSVVPVNHCLSLPIPSAGPVHCLRISLSPSLSVPQWICALLPLVLVCNLREEWKQA